MSAHHPRLLVTGASGQLGHLVIENLLATVPAGQVAGLVRSPEAAERLRARGVQAYVGDYAHPDTLDAAMRGIDRVLLISSNNFATRVEQHRNVADAAKRAGVSLLAYTSVLHADASPLGLAQDHRETEALIRASGVPFVFLRNGWYSENYAGRVGAAIAHGALIGSAGDGRVSSAARADYAAAAAAALSSAETLAGRIFELAGDEAFTLADLAAELARRSGQPIVYKNLPEAEFRTALLGAGLPEGLATLVADSDACTARGALYDGDRQLSALIGRPTTPWTASVAAALAPA